MTFDSNVELKSLGSFRIGGKARFFKQARNIEELAEAIDETKHRRMQFFILGGGTNILWNDDGFDGLVLKPQIGTLERDGLDITSGAGILMSDLVNFSLTHSLSGLEWAGGLPGTLGGAIRGNAGAFKGEMKDIVKEVVSLDTESLKVVKKDNTACTFGYRNSIFKTRSNEVIAEATLSLSPGDKKVIKNTIKERIRYREEQHPMEHPNAGSIFKNVSLEKYPDLDVERFRGVIKTDPFPVIPTAFLVSEIGLKGVSCGGAMISPKHPNFIVNVLDASSQDVKSLINLVKSEIFDRFKVELEEEIQILSEKWY